MKRSGEGISEKDLAINITERQRSNFWERIDKISDTHGCWLWLGRKDRDGYGNVSFRKTKYRVHRISWILTHGDIPIETPLVLHDCPSLDNRACCNPCHLWLGTHDDNIKDAAKKGRMASGANHGSRTHPESVPRGSLTYNAKLTESDVRHIRRLYATGMYKLFQLAEQFGIASSNASFIVNRVSWKHVP